MVVAGAVVLEVEVPEVEDSVDLEAEVLEVVEQAAVGKASKNDPDSYRDVRRYEGA